MIHVIVWLWTQPDFRESYTYKQVNQVSRMVRGHTTMPVRILAVTDNVYGIDAPTETYPLWKDFENLPNATGRHLPSCYRRLRLFDHATQKAMGIKDGDVICSLDLDSIVTGDLDPLFKKITDSTAVFTGWGVRGTYHEMVFNGSFWAFKAGSHLQHVWSDFDPGISPRETLAKMFLGSDQSWLSRQFAKRSDVQPIRYPEFASYPREVKRMGKLDARTRIVFFHGARKPWHPIERQAHPWIVRHWPGDNPHEPRK